MISVWWCTCEYHVYGGYVLDVQAIVQSGVKTCMRFSHIPDEFSQWAKLGRAMHIIVFLGISVPLVRHSHDHTSNHIRFFFVSLLDDILYALMAVRTSSE